MHDDDRKDLHDRLDAVGVPWGGDRSFAGLAARTAWLIGRYTAIKAENERARDALGIATRPEIAL